MSNSGPEVAERPTRVSYQDPSSSSAAQVRAGSVEHEAPAAEVRSSRYLYLRHRVRNGLALLAGDTLALGAALVLAGTARFLLVEEPYDPKWGIVLLGLWTAGSLLLGLLPGWGLGAVEELRRVTLLLLFSYFALAVVLFFSKAADTASRITFAAALLLSLGFVPLFRTIVKRWLVRQGLWGVPIAIYGAGEPGAT